MNKFEVIFLTEAREFLLEIDEKSRDKIIFNIDKAKIKNDNELFKKLKGEIFDFSIIQNPFSRKRLPETGPKFLFYFSSFFFAEHFY